jgi:5-methylcytosine-specific restriction endonuclease McrA
MDPYQVSHFSHDALLEDLKKQAARDRAGIAVLLSRIAEVDERKLYLREGYPSMYQYCLRELHFSEGTAYKRIQAGRAARRFPVLLLAVAEGRLHLSAVVTLAAYLSEGNIDDLLAAATHKTRAEIEELIARRFPRPDAAGRPTAVTPLPAPAQLSPGTVEASRASAGGPVPEWLEQLSPGTVAAPPGPAYPTVAPPPSRMTPPAPERPGRQVTVSAETYELLQEALALMAHQNPRQDMALAIDRAARLLVAHLKKQRFAATAHPRSRPPEPGAVSGAATGTRHIPAAVKRAVWERDGGQCSYVSDSGHRCDSRSMLEFDHIDPVSRGGGATVENLRLLCRAHNQYAAEREFGVDFMSRKREEARR